MQSIPFKSHLNIDSTALIEIGQYNTFENENILLESASELIQNLKIVFIHRSIDKDHESLSIKTIEDEKTIEFKLIKIEIDKPSIELGKQTLDEIITYIENRHSNLLSKNTQKTKRKLTYEIESLNDQIEFSNNTLLTQNEDEKLRISNQIESLNEQIEYGKSALLTQNEDEKLRISNQIESLNEQIEYEKLRISNQIESLNEQIEYINNTLVTQNEDEKLRISNQIESLNNELPGLEAKIESLKEIIFCRSE